MTDTSNRLADNDPQGEAQRRLSQISRPQQATPYPRTLVTSMRFAMAFIRMRCCHGSRRKISRRYIKASETT
jgi:hypothetical protein